MFIGRSMSTGTSFFENHLPFFPSNLHGKLPDSLSLPQSLMSPDIHSKLWNALLLLWHELFQNWRTKANPDLLND